MKSILLSFLILFSINTLGQDRSHQFDSLFTSLFRENKFTGNILIAESGKAIFRKSYGKAFREKGDDLNNETIFELASVSKQFTAMGIMLLKRQGKITYEDSLRKFFPELPYHNITIRQLLQHTSGLPDYMDLAKAEWDSTKILTNSDLISLLARHKPSLIFRPGEKWDYSNTGYALLASIIDKASGTKFPDYLAQNIFSPLGMTRTTVYRKRFDKKILDNYAYGYVEAPDGKFVMADSLPETATMVYSLDGIYGDGVVNSTTGDLLKWDQALYTNKLLPAETMREAFMDARLNNGKIFNYGFGWLLADSNEFGRYYFHAGGWPGYSTWMERHPRDNKTIIFLANAGSANGSIRAVRNILYGIETKPPVEIEVSETVLQLYAGSYQFDHGDTLNIRFNDGGLFARSAGRKEYQLYPEAPDVFFRKDRDDVRIKMKRSSDGTVNGLEVLRDGPPIEAVRIESEHISK